MKKVYKKPIIKINQTKTDKVTLAYCGCAC